MGNFKFNKWVTILDTLRIRVCYTISLLTTRVTVTQFSQITNLKDDSTNILSLDINNIETPTSGLKTSVIH